MNKKKKCGSCGWFKKGFCRKPQGVFEDAYVGKDGFACDDHLEARKK